jgi:DNA-binding GntR family transcriptional regulator
MVKYTSVVNPPVLAPLGAAVQRANRVYEAVLNGIIKGELAPGVQLKADTLAQQLRVSATPVRDALNRLVEDGLVYKLPYQGWFVCQSQDSEIRDLYEMRACLECFGVGRACERITPEELERLHAIQEIGDAALAREDMEAYRMYNQEFHLGIMRASQNSLLPVVFGQISMKTQMLSAKTIRTGRPSRAVEEHRCILRLIANRDGCAAQEVMRNHILGALEDILGHGPR